MRQLFLSSTALALCLLGTPAMATPESSTPSLIKELRPYINGSVFIRMESTELCDTTVFAIAYDAAGKKEMYAAALAAFLAGKKVRLEALTATGCVGWGTQLQSIYVADD